MANAAQLIQTHSRFQRAIHLRYDLRDGETIRHYIPTPSAVNALAAILRGTLPEGTQRAHVLYAAYGAGKSHLAVTLAALLENSASLQEPVQHVVERIVTIDEQTGDLAKTYHARKIHLLPVVLSGNEGDLGTALLRALNRALREARLDQIPLTTHFEAALDALLRWEAQYPELHERLLSLCKERHNLDIEQLRQGLDEHNAQTLAIFQGLYTTLTGGATLSFLDDSSPELVFREVAERIQGFGYHGLVILWDEFGRYLEAHTAQAFSEEAALLQSLAETCNYSGNAQLHLLLFTHKELQGYASTLPPAYQQEWARIEGRFQKHDLSTDPYVVYHLIGAALQQTDPIWVETFLAPQIDALTRQSQAQHLFGILESTAIARLIYETWPLHPLTVFALAHLSQRIAQNERTLFTFLTADEPHALLDVMRQKTLDDHDDIWVRTDVLWDYFADAIRADIGGTGAHHHWAGVTYALDKVPEGDSLGVTLLKTLGVLLICAEVTPIKPTTELLSWAVGAETEEQQTAVATTLENLRRRKVIIYRQVDGYWTFLVGSDINLEERLGALLDRANPTPTQLRRILQDYFPAPHTLARRYNQQHAMIRYFTGLYRWPEELEDVAWDVLLERLETDGLIVYVLIEDELGRQQALKFLQPHERVVYVFPRQGEELIALRGALRELFALQELSNDAFLTQHEDRVRIQHELSWLLEDTQARLQHIVSTLTDPRANKTDWLIVTTQDIYGYPIRDRGQATKIVSDICAHVFPATPEFNSEGLNVFHPSSQQLLAAQKVIDALFSQEPDETFGMRGRGPEILALNTLLKLPGILRQTDDGNWTFGRPENNPPLTEVWDLITAYIASCRTPGGQPIAPLIQQLTAPPYGIRLGILPILLAAVLRSHLKVTTVRKDGHSMIPIDGALLTQMIFDPTPYTLEVQEWNATLDKLWKVLEARFGAYIHESEQNQQPLTRLRVAMLRWLQGLPPFCRNTRQLTDNAQAFRQIVRKAQLEPARALFEELPALLGLQKRSSTKRIEAALDNLINEVSGAYLDLQRRLDMFARKEFGQGRKDIDGPRALFAWLESIQRRSQGSLTELKFSSLIAQQFVNTLLTSSPEHSQLWDKISLVVLGLHLRDWTDESETHFYARLREVRTQVERETQELLEAESTITVMLQWPDATEQSYRFRRADLSAQGQRLLQNFKSTLEIAGRPLSADEKRQVAVAFLMYVMGDISAK